MYIREWTPINPREDKSKIENLSSSHYKEMVSEVLPTPGRGSSSSLGAGLPRSLHPPLIPTKTVQKVVKGGSSTQLHQSAHCGACGCPQQLGISPGPSHPETI